MNPGDTRMVTRWCAGRSIAQPRPGREPRRHAVASIGLTGVGIAQPRPGREPRRHRPLLLFPAGRVRTLNQGRGVNPGDTRHGTCVLGGRDRALNQGRGVNPGDTTTAPSP